MIEARGLTKRFGDKVAVDDLSFTVQPGIVTGFLGPNGAGKSTTMRMILGLDRPTRGLALVNGHPYAVSQGAAARGRRAARREGRARRPYRAGTPALARAVQRAAQAPGRRGARADRHVGGRRQADQGLLARHVAAARHRRRDARRSADPDVRRAGQRPRPRGHPVDPQLHAAAGAAMAAPCSSPAT